MEVGPAKRRVHWGIRAFVLFGTAGVLLTPFVFFIAVVSRPATPGRIGSQRASPERIASASLKTLYYAQEDYRKHDRDNNKKQDYWRGDVAGLYALKPQGGTETLKMIELSIAGADAAPVSGIEAHTRKSPKAGYWYKALRFADEDPAKPDPDRFAACAYPDSPSSGRAVFIMSHDNTIHKRDWKWDPDTPSVYPADPVNEGWTKLD